MAKGKNTTETVETLVVNMETAAAADNAAAAPQETETAAAETAAAETETKVVPEPESEQLTKIRTDIDNQWTEIEGLKPRTPEYTAATLKLFELQASETAEIANIKKREQELLLIEKQNQRVALLDAVIDAKLASVEFDNSVRGADGTIPAEHHERSNELNAAFKQAREVVANELLKSLPTVRKTVAAGTTAAAGDSNKGDEKTAILAKHVANIAAGKTDAESRKLLEADGHKRSTVWHAVNNYNAAAKG